MVASEIGDAGHAEQREGAGGLLHQEVGSPLHAALAACHQSVEVGAPHKSRTSAESDSRDDVAAGQDAAVDVHLGAVGHRVDHGGRQLDRAPTPLEALPAVVDAVGDRAEVYVDGGILSGSDVVAAVASGARAALVGRAYLYGLMAGGERGVQRAADILRQEVAGTLALLGVTRVSDLRRDHVRIRTG